MCCSSHIYGPTVMLQFPEKAPEVMDVTNNDKYICKWPYSLKKKILKRVISRHSVTVDIVHYYLCICTSVISALQSRLLYLNNFWPIIAHFYGHLHLRLSLLAVYTSITSGALAQLFFCLFQRFLPSFFILQLPTWELNPKIWSTLRFFFHSC